MSKILITGFEPFLDNVVNPTELVIKDLLNRKIELAKDLDKVDLMVLPVTFSEAYNILSNRISSDTEFVIMLGLSGQRSQISLEKVALNWVESSRPDNNGDLQNRPQKINAQSELAIMTNYPINELKDYLNMKPRDLEISFSAGTYVCNYLYYNMLAKNPKIKSLFIHVPEFTEGRFDLGAYVEMVLKTIRFTKMNSKELTA